MNPEQEKYVLSSSFVATVTSKCDKSREQPLKFAQLFGVKGVKEVKGVKAVSLFP